MSETQHTKTIKPATGHEIRAILGPVGEKTVIEIMHTGASASEVQQAVAWLENDDNLSQALHHLTPKAQQVCEILVSDQDIDGLFH